ncbi:radical SAM protein [Eubacterium multiforme]|uniref:Pyruvate formate lyase activating enzyme n=1 Tax=Eubacterium multiforme TaxID=83339 RepID=A0ABT9UWP0_9FIRM|nr:radical SAM protein [Eubacterium multiforme]MDQ0150654.1 putative pyruvate formate lyase activating enzyme [Eubacterium multiforme]
MEYNSLLKNCNLCMRRCNVNRLKGEVGVCNSSDKIKVARAKLHMWEEPPISLDNGSGTVFFSNCNFKCVFCQNHEISQEHKGAFITVNELANIFLRLQKEGANNINLVTPTHYVPQIIEALKIAKKEGLTLPILYNTNGYDSLETIKALKGYIDVYLPDFKYFDDKYAIKYSKAPNYRENLIKILKEMFSQVSKNKFDNKGRMIKGMIIRHLMLPGLLFDSKKVIDTIYSLFGDNVYISIMNQYTPMFKAFEFKEISKPLNPKVYDSLINYAAEIGIKNAFIQDNGTNTTDFVPSFNLEGVFE